MESVRREDLAMGTQAATAVKAPSPLGDLHRYCGRDFSREEIYLIGRLIAVEPPLNRAQLSRRACDELDWVRPDGRRKDMSCRVAMLRMERDGLIRLPAPSNTNANGRIKPASTAAGDPRQPIDGPLRALGQIALRPVDTRADSALWNELIQRYHYLGYKPLPGAQLRYLAFAGSDPLGALGFGAAAWMAAPRDRFIGWRPEQRTANLHRVVNNARFLILPWVNVKNLASKILGLSARQIAADWEIRYGFAPVLLETFVERDRFRGTCYRAANWTHLGQTKGRGKLNKTHRQLEPIKDIYVYPLARSFRRVLAKAQ
jgi:hypothetical protein